MPRRWSGWCRCWNGPEDVCLGPGDTDLSGGGSHGHAQRLRGPVGLVRDSLQCEPLSGHIFVFSNRQRNRLKLLFWDNSGLWVCSKRLEKGRFGWPAAVSGQDKVVLSHEELALLLGGIDLTGTKRRRWYRANTAAG